MATTVFSSWSDLKEYVQDLIASNDVTASEVWVGDNRITYQSIADLIKLLTYIETRAALESGTASLRVYAKNGGRG